MTPREHIHTLAAELGVPVLEDCGSNLRAGRSNYDVLRDRWTAIHVPVLGDDPRTYWIALHELGHVATTDLSRGTALRAHYTSPRAAYHTSPEQLDAESEAHHWALDHAEAEMTPEVQMYTLYAISTYRKTAESDTPRYLELIDRLEALR